MYFLLSFELITVSNQSSRAKHMFFTLIPRPKGLGCQHRQQQYLYHSSTIPPEVYIE